MKRYFRIIFTIDQYNALRSILIDHINQKDSTRRWINAATGTAVTADELLAKFNRAQVQTGETIN